MVGQLISAGYPESRENFVRLLSNAVWRVNEISQPRSWLPSLLLLPVRFGLIWSATAMS